MASSMGTTMKLLVKEHWAALTLALVAALIVLAPNLMLWREPEFKGIEMMMHDAENHYLARIVEVSEGHSTAGNTFLPNKNIPYATPPLGEDIIALFAKAIHVEPARAAIISKSVSVFIITILIYALAFALSGSRIASLLAAAVPMFGYNLIAFSPAPFLDLLRGSPSGGPFVFFSRLVNPSIAGIFMFASLLRMFREFFQSATADGHEKAVLWKTIVIGLLVGATLYITPFTYTFLGLVMVLSFGWFLIQRKYEHASYIFLSGTVGLLAAVPFLFNYMALSALPGYEHLSQFLGLVHRREFILGALLPLIALVVGFLWPKGFSKPGKVFFLIISAALLCVLNQQMLTGSYLQPGHYHWYLTKPLAGVLAGLFAGYLIERFVAIRFRPALTAALLLVLVYNSMGFLAPWYQSTRANALSQQKYGPLVAYLNTIEAPQVVWTDEYSSDFIPIYTHDDAPNSVNAGSYPIPQTFFENRLFLEYRLKGIVPKDFENTIRTEAHHVGDRLWGLWLREKFGDPSAVPEEEFGKLSQGYAAFYALPWAKAFDLLDITLVVSQTGEVGEYSRIPVLKEQARVGDFVIYRRI
ncbi:hypothetical protein K2Q00_00570 [Patescibacteria group bacterium]|nr:hypothetical protein [Patescibacteria group bacterium]